MAYFIRTIFIMNQLKRINANTVKIVSTNGLYNGIELDPTIPFHEPGDPIGTKKSINDR